MPGGRYQTQGFTTQPAVRPSYIPQSYGGNTIIFVPGMGYGYYNPMGIYQPYVYHQPFYSNIGLIIFLIIVILILIAVFASRRRSE